MALLDKIDWPTAIIVALLLGLAPFFPEPHLWEKLKMLFAGDLHRALDWFDLLMHGAPIALLVLKAVRALRLRQG
ncbi:RND transporter [Phaeobacter sp. QD34_3]|uniref:RND transporter n=1 Tax=unclassified Phaeobacter TaxID=2621772 RepID=UPI00237EF135|nr:MULTISPECIES: RND transporter [unclassified Phaeobacter]MDE4134479.1 RND transporter [Phaeobacter sp. QD34_3]MDE4138131.1 RND transporter [Phaeobacter sp. QD34_24]